MGKPSNVSLLADKKAVAALVEAEAGESLSDAVNRALEAKNAELVQLRGLLATTAEKIKAIPMEPNPGPPPIERQIGPHPGLVVDSAVYLPRGSGLPEPAPNVLTAQEGDMRPAYVRWMLANEGAGKILAHYGERQVDGPNNTKVRIESRIHLLPADVQAAIQ